ncbi:hypothetical protein EC968_003833 [Mortierella alpina]|nr:hypothetical protein EC968_003833 [Mortierella alpina]
MSALGESSAAELAKRYQEKAQARKRGAGSHQPKFRGFSLKTLSDKADIAASEGRKIASTNAEASKTKSTRQLKLTTAQATTNDAEQNASAPNDALALKDTGLNERYQERFKTRVRGTGQDRAVVVESATVTRSSVSPGFKIAWGKKTTVITSETSSHSKDRLQRTTTPEPDEVLGSTHEATLPDYDDFDQGQMPSPTRDEEEVQTAPVDAGESVQRREAVRSKRKPISSTLVPEAAVNGKRSGVSSKRRRIINEETDENEDPLSVTEIQSVDHLKALAGKSARKANGGDDAVPTKSTRAVPSSRVPPTKTSKAGRAALSKETSGPLRQTTLVQLSSKPGQNTSSRDQDSAPEADQSDSDFISSMAISSRHALTAKSDRKSTKKTATASQKVPSDKTVKNYKQLQIHCLKFWGPATAVSRPATVSNQTIARQLPVEGEVPPERDSTPKQKLVQGILQVEEAPLSEMDVIAEVVRDTVDKFIESIEEQAIAKDIQTFRSELETALIEQVDLLDDHSLLRASVKKASALKKELRVRLLETQRGRQRTRMKLQRVRSDFEREERARRRLEETHKFLTDLETLREEVEGSDNDQENERLSNGQKDQAKTGLRSLIATVGSRCQGGSASADATDASSGLLGTLADFNRTLEAMEKTVREMPRISKSQEVTPSNWSNDLGASDDSDY